MKFHYVYDYVHGKQTSKNSHRLDLSEWNQNTDKCHQNLPFTLLVLMHPKESTCLAVGGRSFGCCFPDASDPKLSIRQTNSLRFSFSNHETQFNENYDMTFFVEQFNSMKKTQQENKRYTKEKLPHKQRSSVGEEVTHCGMKWWFVCLHSFGVLWLNDCQTNNIKNIRGNN